ncbi:MAG TPA: allantoinase PuuE [Alphaproteobacteria bacterium]|nr:allantoinase PuuE [Alphaproteobacteria bacterium]
MPSDYPRDLLGYGPTPPQAGWPGGARLALSLVLNYEVGGENTVLHGDAGSEQFLADIGPAHIEPLVGARAYNTESMFEYGSRAGFWRIHRLLTSRQVPLTVYGVGMALERNPEAAEAMAAAGWEVASHAYRWINYAGMAEAEEREQMQRAIEAVRSTVGERPVGWYCGRVGANTRRLVVEEGGFLYDSDSYADDLPYWNYEHGRPHLILPYSLDNNDLRFSTNGIFTGEDFFDYIRDAFDLLYAEDARTPKMMSVGLHCRLAGRPGRINGLARFLDHVQAHDDVWITLRRDIAAHWVAEHPPEEAPA